MPELAAAYAVGFLASLLLSGVFFLLWSRYRERPEALTLNENLKTAGVYWSDREDRLRPWEAEAVELDRRKAATSLFATCAGLSFLGWAGFLFILILMVSYRFLARSRFELRLLSSPLATEPRLLASRVDEVLREIRLEFPRD